MNAFWPILINSVVTVLAGGIAYIVYRNQKRDFKKNAANIILLEIQNAERVAEQVRESIFNETSPSLPNKFLLSNDSWSQYKHLFVRDLDRDEWDKLSDFFWQAYLYDEAVKYKNSFFEKNEEQIRANYLSIPAEYIRDVVNDVVEKSPEEAEVSLERAIQKGRKFQETYLQRGLRELTMLYEPQKPTNEAKSALSKLNLNLSQSSIGVKLKLLADVDKKQSWLPWGGI